LVGACEWLDGLTTDLQEVVMRTRMQPIGNVWSKFPRLVRDLAMQCGKQVHVEMQGEETELDRTIVEAIKDPLTHLLRNAVDHGIEPAEERLRAGKPGQGVLRLRAEYAAGQVNIELSDDGRGLDYARIRRKAVERGMITLDRAATLSDHDAAQLIFAPGFSTAERITHLSGRGVGMDVVKTNIERIGGTVEIHSRAGTGCSVRLSIPLTLLVIPPLRDVPSNELIAKDQTPCGF
jgi:two-component system chemotaxis sensor kinase CheA